MPSKVKKFFEVLKFDNRFELLLGLIVFRKSKVFTYRYKGIQALVDHSCGDQDGVRSCLVPGLYDAFFHEIDGMLRGKKLTFVDMGANTGGFVLALLANGYEIGKGVCVELNPITCTRLSWNLAQNSLLSKVSILSAAVASQEGVLQVALSKGSVGDSLYTTDENSTALTQQEVSAVTIDQIILRQAPGDETVNLCKIDIEGAEYEAILHGKSEELKRCQILIIEIHQRVNFTEDELINHLVDNGFHLVKPKLKPIEDNVFLFVAK